MVSLFWPELHLMSFGLGRPKVSALQYLQPEYTNDAKAIFRVRKVAQCVGRDTSIVRSLQLQLSEHEASATFSTT